MAAALSIAAPRVVRADRQSTLTYVPSSDLGSLDPVNLASGTTKVHAAAVFETLFAMNGNRTVVPQMLEGYSVARDGLEWRLTLRPGLWFHDGEPVLARDVVTSLHRWAGHDILGRRLLAQTDLLAADTDRDVVFRLQRPFPLLPYALGKPDYYGAFIMPERLARATDPLHPVAEVIGSGPYRYVANERVAGERVVYARFDRYAPRVEPPDCLAGARVAGFDRVVWKVLPDPATAASALINGEVDWLESPISDLLPRLRANPRLDVVVRNHHGGNLSWIFNCHAAPFSNVAVRRSVLAAIDQGTFLQAAFGDDRRLWQEGTGVWEAGSPMATDAGMDRMSGDIAQAKRELALSGYNGEPAVVMGVADVPSLYACAQVATDLLRRIGINAILDTVDYGTLVQRRTKDPGAVKGGWGVLFIATTGYGHMIPATHGEIEGFYGAPALPELADLREAWMNTQDMAAQREIARKIQLLVWEEAHYIPLGTFYTPTAFSRTLAGVGQYDADFVNVRRL